MYIVPSVDNIMCESAVAIAVRLRRSPTFGTVRQIESRQYEIQYRGRVHGGTECG